MSRDFTAIDVQKIRVEKLMKNPDKPIDIPMRREDKKFAEPPDFVRNIMGSSAGAGSGEFHVYRHLRRKEYARLRHIDTQAKQEKLDEDFKQRIDDNKRLAEEKTAKKRAKRQKRKQKLRSKKSKTEKSEESKNSDIDESDEQEEEEAVVGN
ncbi:unnamed protein product [Medioppia subpectinata]|uniref:PRKR-interacting protein 1 n=1 Tax=Medioppia subpectinata TaxID=1979941 RepID=A0A7R9KZ43_9ACAR|nr:unnamed protein product [Medioppia subpectinata]CAG2111286.1 unnamed protein product [Medioppia subpectinata]